MARVTLVTAAPALPAGTLTWPAWQALQAAEVLLADGDRQLSALRAAGVQVRTYDPAADLPELLHTRARAIGQVAWLGADGADLGARLAPLRPAIEVRLLPGPAAPRGARLLEAVTVMDRLRSPGGCPWDARQTHASLKAYLLEEAYEAYQALEDGDDAGLREELGDVLLQVLFHARLAQEADPGWSVDDVAAGLVDKLVRRHPHVFAGAGADDLEGAWEAHKAAEGRTSVTEGVALGSPALSLAARLQRRGGRLGAPVPRYDGPGGQLWELVRGCGQQDVDAEEALRAVARRYRDELAAAEAAARADGLQPAGLTALQWQRLWGVCGGPVPG